MSQAKFCLWPIQKLPDFVLWDKDTHCEYVFFSILTLVDLLSCLFSLHYHHWISLAVVIQRLIMRKYSKTPENKRSQQQQRRQKPPRANKIHNDDIKKWKKNGVRRIKTWKHTLHNCMSCENNYNSNNNNHSTEALLNWIKWQVKRSFFFFSV